MDIELSPVDGPFERPPATSPYEDWGPVDPAATPTGLERWLIFYDGDVAGDLSAHPVWYGPTSGSMAMNIGITVLDRYRGRGIGAAAQRMLAELLHDRGIVRVEASTDVENIPEQRALEKAGFKLEGVARGAQFRRDGRHDLQVWSHLLGRGGTHATDT